MLASVTKRDMLKLETVDCSIEGEERLIYIQLTKHRNFQSEGNAIQQDSE